MPRRRVPRPASVVAMSDDVLTGGCNCGAVRYEVDGPLRRAVYCHCHRCQRRSGAAASPSGLAQPGTFRLLQGEEALRAWAPEDGAEKWFCSTCGSAMYARRVQPDGTELIAVRLGTFDTDPGVRPDAHAWCESAAPWEALPDDGLPKYPQGLPG